MSVRFPTLADLQRPQQSEFVFFPDRRVSLAAPGSVPIPEEESNPPTTEFTRFLRSLKGYNDFNIGPDLPGGDGLPGDEGQTGVDVVGRSGTANDVMGNVVGSVSGLLGAVQSLSDVAHNQFGRKNAIVGPAAPRPGTKEFRDVVEAEDTQAAISRNIQDLRDLTFDFQDEDEEEQSIFSLAVPARIGLVSDIFSGIRGHFSDRAIGEAEASAEGSPQGHGVGTGGPSPDTSPPSPAQGGPDASGGPGDGPSGNDGGRSAGGGTGGGGRSAGGGGPGSQGGGGSDADGGGSGGGSSGGGSAGGCFARDTMITMASGKLKEIQHVQAGDRVLSFNTEGVLEPKKVLEKYVFTDKQIWFMKLGNGKSILVTEDHPFRTEGGWKRTRDLDHEDNLINEEGSPVKIEALGPSVLHEDVYNFNVEDNHTYLAEGFRVHNLKHEGGMITDYDPSTYQDNINVTAQEGEFVFSRKAVEKLGLPFLEMLNNAFK